MQHSKEWDRASVEIGSDTLVIRLPCSSTPIVAGILGMECDDDDIPTKIWLDRLVHPEWAKSIGGYSASGAVTTILHWTSAITTCLSRPD